MAKPLNISTVMNFIEEGKSGIDYEFSIVKTISSELNADSHSKKGRNAVIKLLEKIDKFPITKDIINSLVREVGLFPYLDDSSLSLKDMIAYEFHKPKNLPQFVFHREQLKIYKKLKEHKSIILSAPTSFGKSKIIDAIIADNIFQNIVIIVPTIALIDETRKRLTSLFRESYKIISHHMQRPNIEGKNIFIFTPERVVAHNEMFPDNIDFFVIDEFYKIGGQSEEGNRVTALNEAFYILFKNNNSTFYMIGPNVQDISDGARERFSFEFIKNDFNTVITNIIPIINKRESRVNRLVALWEELKGPTLIFCKSINQLYDVANILTPLNPKKSIQSLSPLLANWLATEYHPNWTLVSSLESGIGLHYGALPRSITQEIVRLFNEGELNFLLCTSTLIEGVNTAAKNMVIYENKIAKNDIDYFTYNNIVGRAGRMFKHFVGNVYIFDFPPQPELPYIKFPVHDQDDSATDGLLIQLSKEDLNAEAHQRIQEIELNSPLPLDLLRENHGIDPSRQIEIYNLIMQNLSKSYELLSWDQLPTYEQLEFCCKLIWDYLASNPKNLGGNVLSYKQLTLKIYNLQKNTCKTTDNCRVVWKI